MELDLIYKIYLSDPGQRGALNQQLEQFDEVLFSQNNGTVQYDIDDPRFSEQWGLEHANNYDIDGPEVWELETGSSDMSELPEAITLYQNYPNPFNQRTIIHYFLPDIGYQPADVKLVIYDILGREVRTLVDENQYPGEYSVNWDGKDDIGNELPSGIYFSRLFISKIELTKPGKLMLMR